MYPSEKHSQALKCKTGHHKHTNTMFSTVPFKKSTFICPPHLMPLTSYLLLMAYDECSPLLKGKGDIQITHSCYISKPAYWL